MPQMTKGGKYIFGWSKIKEDGKLSFPTMAIKEYKLEKEKYIYIVSGSKQTGGFCVMSEVLLSDSKLNSILVRNKCLAERSLKEGELILYKGRMYGWLSLNGTNVNLPQSLMDFFGVNIGDKLLAIRSSNIAFTMGFRGSLIDKANNFKGKIETF